jgi:hypothetical protein
MCLCVVCVGVHHGYIRDNSLDTNSINFITLDFCVEKSRKNIVSSRLALALRYPRCILISALLILICHAMGPSQFTCTYSKISHLARGGAVEVGV